MRYIGLPVAIRHTGGCSDCCSAATRAHFSNLYSAPGSPASDFPTGNATTRALCATGTKGPPGNAQTIGDYHSRHIKTSYASIRAQTAAGAGVHATSATNTAAHHA